MNNLIQKTGLPIVFILMLLHPSVSLRAQNSTTSPRQSNMQNSMPDTDTSAATEEKLVQLALKQPEFSIGASQEKIIQYQLAKSRRSWLDVLSLSANYNDQTFAKTTSTSQYVYPKYFFGFTIPLGVIFNAGSDIKIAREHESINKAQQDIQRKKIREEVLAKYQEFLADGSLLLIENQAADDAQAQFLQAEEKFKEGSITIDQYNQASKNYNNELSAKINLQLQQDLAKLDLERMIGMKLEDALNLKTN